ncbi:hypothetical protein E3P99_01451 [Wallemia hederae]|uniref:tRNA (guanine(26)-N(2))-dimethyltransferase n=1 Tax=Wallemia hederae TaxID=1540922 RepID=A0A4T0FUM5_9BASI|nr:hypothetical protein E3P99_01451 [Wallemia hederae]
MSQQPITTATAATQAIPSNYKLTSENSAQILVPITEQSDNKAFINPIQEFNRDLSVASISVWSEMVREEKMAKFAARRSKGKGKRMAEENPDWQFKFSILDALSATGLRAIRYAKEIPNADRIYANDFLPDAVEAIRRNVEYNGVSDKVSATEGDASALMYQHRSKAQFDVIDLDPYGTAAPFVDAAVQSLSNGGLLCITCTDTAVMAGSNYPEKCYSNYGGTPVKAEYSHEAALRLILNSVSQSAARYGRYIEPLMSLSIDFYVRMWIRVHDGLSGTKKAFSKAGLVHVCSFCRSHKIQAFGRVVTKTSDKGAESTKFQAPQTAHVGENGRCDECSAVMHANGPMWIDTLHNKTFTKRLLEHVENNASKYGTAHRMKGMVSTANEELDAPFYFTTDTIASAMKLAAPSMLTVASGLVNAGYHVSRSHALAGSIKTDAPASAIHDMFRKWMKTRPIKLDNVKEGSPTRVLVTKEAVIDADLTHNQTVIDMLNNKERMTRYQANPANWGPLAKPAGGPPRKKGTEEGVEKVAKEDNGTSVEASKATTKDDKLDNHGKADSSGDSVDKNVGEKRTVDGANDAHDNKKAKLDV